MRGWLAGPGLLLCASLASARGGDGAGEPFYRPVFFEPIPGWEGSPVSLGAGSGSVGTSTSAGRRRLERVLEGSGRRAQYEFGFGAGPDSGVFGGGRTYSADDPIRYEGPPPWTVPDDEHRDGPRIPEPMVYDLVRGLGARRGELEVNVLNIAAFKRRGTVYEWAPEIEYALFDGFAVEYELPVEGSRLLAHKFALQYTFGTAFEDAFIHGAQFIGYADLENDDFIPTLLYLFGVRFDDTWSLFAMLGGTYGDQIFPFGAVPRSRGFNAVVNLSLFADVTEDLRLGIETNFTRQISGVGELLLTPQLHYDFNENFTLQIGYGLAESIEGRHGELIFRVIWER